VKSEVKKTVTEVVLTLTVDEFKMLKTALGCATYSEGRSKLHSAMGNVVLD